MLRPYQNEIRKEIYADWQLGYKRVMARIDTGGGKTILFIQIIKDFLLAHKRSVVIAHRRELIDQTWRKLYEEQIYAGKIMAGEKQNFALPVQVGSVQTMIRKNDLPPAHLVIIDEGHHVEEDNSYGSIISNHYPNSFILFVTATPYRLSGKGFTNICERFILGPKFKDLISMGWLVPIRYFVCGRIALNKIATSKGDYKEEEAEKIMALAPLVESYMEHAKGKIGICFAVNVSHSLSIVDQYTKAGLRAIHIDADTDKDIRKQIFSRLAKREIDIIVNVGIATEGTDIPEVEFIQLAKPTKSLSLYLQMVGRGTRPLFEYIKHCQTDEERTTAIMMSPKPSCLILDNASLNEEHRVLPTDDINWTKYFNGIPKKKKNETLETIELIEFVAENEDGERITSKYPEEIQGLRLVEITHSVREKVVNITSLKEFDKNLEMFKRMPKVNKPGMVAYFKYKEFCQKNNILMTTEIWQYLIKRLCDEPEDLIAKEKAKADASSESLLGMYYNGVDQSSRVDEESKIIREASEKRVSYIERSKVARGFIKKEMTTYLHNEK